MHKKDVPVISRSYHIPLAMFDDAFRNFQKKHVFPANILLTVVLLAIAGVYIRAAIADNSKTLVYLLIVACFAIILVRWYKTFRLRRAGHDALKEIESDTYTVSIFEDGHVIHTEDEKPVETAENPEREALPVESDAQQSSDENGFQQIFPEEPVQTETIQDTEITFGPDVKIYDFPDYFMVYLVKQNFYVIPKKVFSADELETLKKLFHI